MVAREIRMQRDVEQARRGRGRASAAGRRWASDRARRSGRCGAGPARSVTSRSPFGSHAIPHGCDSAFVTTTTRILCCSAVSRTIGPSGSGTGCDADGQRVPAAPRAAAAALLQQTMEAIMSVTTCVTQGRARSMGFMRGEQYNQHLQGDCVRRKILVARTRRRPPPCGSSWTLRDRRAGQEPRLAGVLRRQGSTKYSPLDQINRTRSRTCRSPGASRRAGGAEGGVPEHAGPGQLAAHADHGGRAALHEQRRRHASSRSTRRPARSSGSTLPPHDRRQGRRPRRLDARRRVLERTAATRASSRCRRRTSSRSTRRPASATRTGATAARSI